MQMDGAGKKYGTLTLAWCCYLLQCFARPVMCQPDASATLQQLANDFWEWELAEFPEWATVYGFHQHDDKLESYAYQKFDHRWNTCNAFLLRALAINRTSLPADDVLTLDVLVDQLQTFVDGYDYIEYTSLNPINFMEGIHRHFGWIKEGRFQNMTDFNSYISRLYKLPQQVEEIISLLEKAVQLGRTYHAVSMRNVVDDLDELAEADPDQTVFFDPVKKRLDESGLSYHDRQLVRSKVLAVISSGVQPAYKRLSNYISIRYMANTRSEYGIWSLENGTEYYRSALRWHLSTDLDPEEVFRIGMDEVSRIERRMKQLMDWLGFHSTLQEFFEFLSNQNQFYNHTEEGILEQYRHVIYVRTQPRLPRLFSNLDLVPNITIKRMPYDGVDAQYIKNTLLANTRRPQTRASYAILPMALHEAIPGHHLQLSLAQQLPMASFRRYIMGARKYSVPFSFPYYTAYVEGWALYAEFLGEEMGLYDRPYEQFGRYCLEMLRACRLVVDTGIHIKRWSRDYAIEFMSNYTTLSREQIEVEIDRYITWPGQACAYKIGEIKIKELREKAVQTLGYRFDVKEFHSQILNVGPSPLRILEDIITSWIDSHNVSSGSTELSTARSFIITYWTIPVWFVSKLLLQTFCR